MPYLPLYAFMACTGAIIPFYLNHNSWRNRRKKATGRNDHSSIPSRARPRYFLVPLCSEAALRPALLNLCYDISTVSDQTCLTGHGTPMRAVQSIKVIWMSDSSEQEDSCGDVAGDVTRVGTKQTTQMGGQSGLSPYCWIYSVTNVRMIKKFMEYFGSRCNASVLRSIMSVGMPTGLSEAYTSRCYQRCYLWISEYWDTYHYLGPLFYLAIIGCHLLSNRSPY
jgi:hypothetical protein